MNKGTCSTCELDFWLLQFSWWHYAIPTISWQLIRKMIYFYSVLEPHHTNNIWHTRAKLFHSFAAAGFSKTADPPQMSKIIHTCRKT